MGVCLPLYLLGWRIRNLVLDLAEVRRGHLRRFRWINLLLVGGPVLRRALRRDFAEDCLAWAQRRLVLFRDPSPSSPKMHEAPFERVLDSLFTDNHLLLLASMGLFCCCCCCCCLDRSVHAPLTYHALYISSLSLCTYKCTCRALRSCCCILNHILCVKSARYFVSIGSLQQRATLSSSWTM